MNLIKVSNPDKANQLAKSGFKYTTELFNGKTIYVFMITDEIIKFIQNSFTKNDFFIDKTMNF